MAAAQAGGLHLDDLDDLDTTREQSLLEGAAGIALDSVSFSESGAIVAGADSGRPRLWDAATGRALLR